MNFLRSKINIAPETGIEINVGNIEFLDGTFLKPHQRDAMAYADTPVQKSKKEYTRARWQIDAHAFWKSSGNRFLNPDEIKSLPIDKVRLYFRDYDQRNIYDHDLHVSIGEAMEEVNHLPATFMAIDPTSKSEWVWDDVNRMITLNSQQTNKKLQNHICPLQFDIVDRIIRRYSNTNDLVYDPFGGLMTVPVRAIKLGRRGIATELNPEYFRDGLFYLRQIESQITAPTLFDVFENEINNDSNDTND